MRGAREPDHEAQRLAALLDYRILDTAAEAMFDGITRLAAYICDVPISLISLIDRERQWFKSVHGLADVAEMTRDVSFCAHAILDVALMEVQDAALDERFRDNPLVTGNPGIRFYAGMPLTNPDGFTLGTLCVIDRRPRALSPSQRAALTQLSEVVVSLFEARRSTAWATRLGEVLENSFNEIYFADAKTLRLIHANEGARRNLQYSLDEIRQLSPLDLKPETEREPLAAQLERLRSGAQEALVLETTHVRKDGSSYPVELRVQLSREDGMSPTFVVIANDISGRRRTQHKLRQAHEMLRASFYESPFPAIALDVNGLIRMWNTAAEKVFGWKEREVLGRINPIVSGRDQPAFAGLCQRVASGETLREIEIQRQRRDGSAIDVMLSAVPLHDSQDRVTAIMAILVDLTESKRTQASLRHEQEFARVTLENLAEGVAACDAQGHLKFFNRIAREWHGLDAEPLPPEHWASRYGLYRADGITPLAREDIPLFRAFQGEAVRNAEFAITVEGGPPRHIQCSGGALFDPAGAKTGAVVVMHDVTERKRAEQERRDGEEYWRLTLDNGQDAFVVMNAEGRIVEWNRQAEAIFGWPRAEIIGRELHTTIIPQQYRERHQRGLERFLATGERKIMNRRVELTACRRDGSELPIELSVVPIKRADGYIFSASLRDITESRNYQRQLEHQANYDTLTSLPNRNLLEDRLHQAIVHAQRYQCLLAVVFLDLDQFKLINDGLGHAAGDQVLKTIATRLGACVRDTDTVARQSGDEFVLVLNNQDNENSVRHVLQRILDAVSQPIILEDRKIVITASVGYSLFPSDGRDAETLAKNADAAMYRAKALGRNTLYAYTSRLGAAIEDRLSLQAALRQAVENQQLFMLYQPQVDLATGRIVAAEVLLRWQHPRMGLLPPHKFIALAEDIGLIAPIGEWVLRSACIQNRRWQNAGLPPIRVSVNLSPRQFRQQGFARSVAEILAETALDPRWLDLELTEGSMMHEARETLANLDALKALGLQISIDDFGTGFSNLAYLKRFSVDRLKIDQAFIKDIGTGPKDTAIVRAVIALGHGLGLKVTAEGVETEQQLTFLRQQGCDEMQGFYFSRPGTAEETERLLREDRRLELPVAKALMR